MSLIQDALKRQQEENENHQAPMKSDPAGGDEATATSVPESMPVAQAPESKASLVMALRHNLKTPSSMPSEPEPEAPLPACDPPVKAGRSRLPIAGIIVLFCMLIAWGGYWIFPHVRQAFGRFDPLLSRLPFINRPVKAPPPPVLPPVAATSHPSAVSVSAPAPWISPAAAAAPAFADEGEDGEKDMVVPLVKEAETPVAVSGPAPVVWPRLKLTAVFSNERSGQSGARLNNRLVLQGDQIDGVILVEIRRDSVVLKCGKETRILKMGATLN